VTHATLVYDDDCGFCTWWAERLADCGDVRLLGFSALDDETRERLPADYEECAHLLTEDTVYSCGKAIEEAALRSDLPDDLRAPVDRLREFDGYTLVRERAYRAVADRRGLFGEFLSADPPSGSGDSG